MTQISSPGLAIPLVMLLIAAVVFTLCKVTMEGPNATIVVVDERTMRLAGRRIIEALENEDFARAYAGVIAMTTWLRSESRNHPSARKRRRYAEILAVMEDPRKGSFAEWISNGMALRMAEGQLHTEAGRALADQVIARVGEVAARRRGGANT